MALMAQTVLQMNPMMIQLTDLTVPTDQKKTKVAVLAGSAAAQVDRQTRAAKYFPAYLG